MKACLVDDNSLRRVSIPQQQGAADRRALDPARSTHLEYSSVPGD